MERNQKGRAEAYPYAHLIVFQFLKTAIAEGAHLKIPDRLEKYENGEARWVRERNIAGTYFSSWATFDEIGKQYNTTREAIRLSLNRFLGDLWRNCSEETKVVFPLQEISDHLADTPFRFFRKTREGKSAILRMAKGGHRYSIGDISKAVGLSENSVRANIRAQVEEGNLRPRLGFYQRLEARVKNLPKNPALRQRLMNMASSQHFITQTTAKDFFVSLTHCLEDAGWEKLPSYNYPRVAEELKKRGVAVGKYSHPAQRGGKEYQLTKHFIFREDLERAGEFLKSLRLSPFETSRIGSIRENAEKWYSQLKDPNASKVEKQWILDAIPEPLLGKLVEDGVLVSLAQFLKDQGLKVDFRNFYKFAVLLQKQGIITTKRKKENVGYHYFVLNVRSENLRDKINEVESVKGQLQRLGQNNVLK